MRIGLALALLLPSAAVAQTAVTIPGLPTAGSLVSGDLIMVDKSVSTSISANGRKTYNATLGQVQALVGIPTLPQNQIFVGNSSAVATATALAGDCSLAAGNITCTATGGVAFGTFATANAVAPPAIGGTTPAPGSFTNLSATGTVTFPAGSVAVTALGTNSFASLTAADQTLSGGANVTSYSIATGNVTIDCGKAPLQYITNGGAFTITAPANDGSCMVLMTNNASAGTVSYSGFTVGSSTGATLTTTNTSKFTMSVWRINGTSGYSWFAHQ